MRIAIQLLVLALGVIPLRAAPTLTAWVPNRWLPQGEMRLYAHETKPRIEVVLHTRHLDRVLKAIEEKERKNWGAHPEAARYIQELRAARAGRPLTRSGGMENLIIEFIGGPDHEIRFLTAEVESGSGSPGLRVRNPIRISSYQPESEYLLRNMALILADRLDVSREEAETILRGSERETKDSD